MVPAEEERRLAVLDSYKVLNTAPEKEYDDLAFLAATICGTPVGMINFVDSDVVFAKSTLGFPGSPEGYPIRDEIEKSASFCVEVMKTNTATLMIRDAQQDDRWKDTTYVKSPGVRFYCGAAVVAPTGERLGTVCVIDWVPRDLQPDQVKALESLARQVTALLEVRKKNALLEAMNAEKTNFLGMISHDLRQPLCSIQVCSEMLLKDCKAPELMEPLECVYASSSLMLELTNRLLHVAKATSTAELVSPSPTNITTNLNDLLTRVVSSNARLALGKHIAMRFVTSGTVPPDLTAAIDPISLQQVLNNLLSNSIKFSPKYSSVTVTLSITGNDAVIGVEDQGPGIPKEEFSRLWQPYQSTSVQPSGGEKSTGLGLFITKRLLERAGGSIECDSVIGKGTTFRVKVRISKQRSKSLSQKVSPVVQRKEDEAKRQKRQLNLLLADDDFLNRRILQSLFTYPAHELRKYDMSRQRGHTCTAVENGQQAFAAVEKDVNAFDVILLDLLMPEMDGIAAAKLIQKISKAAIFLISGADVEELQRHVSELQLAGCFWKPFSARIVNDVEDALANKG